ncbi:hypothetical protein WA026_019487 [Henosepilachna vigintioctopunctata]|uniref:Uncharacterized protein n=1 Tax=Henosepilachna vigintioctopunctata TaxID=420089 RepID=A0AAW1UAS6_9CUCU
MTRPVTTISDVHLTLEISGMWKCFGHPIIDMDKSVKSWISKGSALKEGLEKAGSRVENMFKLVFCRNYYKEKRTWPPVEYNDTTSTRVAKNISKDTWDECAKFPWLSKEFADIRLKQCLSFDMHIDISDLLADKSIIPCRSQWIHEYDKQVHRTMYGKFPSAVISYLEADEVSVEKIIKTIDSGFLPDEWKVIVAVAKEREQKRDAARWYAKMTPEMRLYQTSTESNLAKEIFPYLPHQTMTLNEEQLLRLLLRMTSPKRTSCSDEFRYIVIDFANWCTNHRHELTAPTFRQIDNLFGFRNIYFFTQLFPIQSLLLFQDRFCPPEQGPDGLPMEGIQDVVRNKVVKAMFEASVDDQKMKLIETLSSMEPLNPRLANEIYSLSNPGLQEKFVSKYANTRSIQRMACSTWVSELELLEWVKRTQLAVSERYRCIDPKENTSLEEVMTTPCTTVSSHKLRHQGWGRYLEGVTMPYQSEQSTVMRWEAVPEQWKECTILLHVDTTLTSLYRPPKGNRQPYFGSMTKMRARKAPLQTLEVGSMVSSLKQTLETMMWLKDSPDMVKLMNVLLKAKTHLDILSLNKYARQVYSGTISHRLDALSLRRGGMCNQTSNTPSHIKITSDTATRYAKQERTTQFVFNLCSSMQYL